MDLSASLLITHKGVDEVQNRVYKLSIKKRSILLLLGKPQSMEYILQKTVFNHDEIMTEIEELTRDGFITVSGNGGAKQAPPPVSKATPATGSGNHFQLNDEIILSEAKFLLVDFCVDTFGTQSQAFVDELRECKDVSNFSYCLRKIYAETEKKFPQRLPILVGVINDINETA